MRKTLPPYKSYGPSRLRWLGDIPSHWDEKRAKFYFREVDQRSTTGAEELLSVSHLTGVTPRSEKNVTMFMAESYVGQKLCEPDDLVINIMWAWMGALGVSQHAGIVSSSYGVYRLRDKSLFVPEYLDMLLRTRPYVAEYNVRSTGIRSSRLRLYSDRFFDIPIICPPHDEQKAMVGFLEEKLADIGRFVAAKRRLISLLNEQKLVIINRATSHGVTPGVPLRDAGGNLEGQIPAHWEVRPLKRWVEVNREALPDSTDPDYEMEYIDIGNVGTGYLLEPPEPLLFKDAPSRARRVLRPNDTIISTVRTYLKAVYFVREAPDNLIASTGFAVLTPRKNVVPQFLAYAVQSENFINQVMQNSIGISYPAINSSRLSGLHLAMPRDEAEQQAITEWVEQQTSDLNRAINHALREIELVTEYRDRLISDVVTGRIDIGRAIQPWDTLTSPRVASKV